MSACPHREDAAVTATRRVSDTTVLRQQLRADVGRREVVGGVIRLLPDEEWLRRVRDDLAAEVSADALCPPFHAYASACFARPCVCGGHDALLSRLARRSVPE